MPNAEISPYRISSESLEQHDKNGKIVEFPIMVTKYFGKKIPAGGGFYLRFLSKNKISKSIENYTFISLLTPFIVIDSSSSTSTKSFACAYVSYDIKIPLSGAADSSL